MHPYLLTMAFGIFTAWLLDEAISHGTLSSTPWPRRLVTAIATLALSAALVVAAALTVGYGGGSTVAVGYGIYSMNLAAPLCGGRFIDCVPQALASQPLAAYHFVDATTGQYEGFNYLGLGLWVVLLIALALHARSLPRLLSRHAALFTILLVMAVYALSNRVFWQQTELLSVDLPAWLRRATDTFRASGRFFWPAGYALLFLGLAALLRRRSLWALGIVAVALGLQWTDTGPLRARIQQMASVPPVDDLSAWAPVMAGIDDIRLYPPYDCDRTEPATYLHWQRLAGFYGKRIDTGYISRPSTACRLRAHEFDIPPTGRTLYVTAAARVFDMPKGFVTAAQRDQCIQMDKVVACGPIISRTSLIPGARAIPVLPLSDRLNWRARDLPTLVGVLKDDALVPRDAATPGILSYGPYAAVPTELPPIPVRIALDYASQAPVGQEVGRWDVMLGATLLAEGKLVGTDGARQTIEHVISLADRPAGRLEVRTHFLAKGDLRLYGIAAAAASAK